MQNMWEVQEAHGERMDTVLRVVEVWNKMSEGRGLDEGSIERSVEWPKGRMGTGAPDTRRNLDNFWKEGKRAESAALWFTEQARSGRLSMNSSCNMSRHRLLDRIGGSGLHRSFSVTRVTVGGAVYPCAFLT